MIKQGSTILASDLVLALTAGEALSARDACYISSSDGKVYKCDADDLDKIHFGGFAQEAASLNAAVNLVPKGFLGGFSGLTIGALYYLSGTAGAITTTRPTNAVLAGRAVSATQIKIFDGFTRVNQIIYTSTGANTYTKRAGLAQIFVKVQAAGGGTAGGSSGTSQGGGGGSGAYTEGFLYPDQLGATETATVGAAGAAGGANANGSAGGNSSFGTLMVCTGGGGGTTAGGLGSAGAVSTAGNGLSFAGVAGVVSTTVTSPNRHFPSGASAYMSFGGKEITISFSNTTATGNMDIGYGGGGAPKSGDSTGATWSGVAGLQGIIIIDEYYFY